MTLAEEVAAVRRALQRMLTRHMAATTERPLLELRALRAIHHEGVHTQAELAIRLLVDTAAVSRLVDKLERNGLLKREPGEDRRCVRLKVSAAGLREVRVIDSEVEWLDREVKRHLSAAEVRTMRRLLRKLQDGLAGY
jgi:MarR family transcriptional regulator, transcriptional regulator for hemolysin